MQPPQRSPDYRRFVGSGPKTYEVPLDSEADDQRFRLQIAMLVQRGIDAKTFKPPLLPEVAVVLSEIANRPEVDIREVEAAVVQDPAVAARVLSFANSAFYCRGTPVKSLRIAITRLGLAEVRDIAFQVVAQTRIFRVEGYNEQMHAQFLAAQAAGLVSREICRILRFESELAYLCGLLHDMGGPIILGVVGDAARQNKQPPPPLDSLQGAIEKYHASTGARICTHWKLPPTIVDAVLNHHSPERSNNALQMSLVVAISDLLLAHAGIGTEPKPIEPMREPLFYKLNLSPDQVVSLLHYVEMLASDPSAWAAT